VKPPQGRWGSNLSSGNLESMKLTIGSRYLGEQATDVRGLELSEDSEIIGLFDLAELSKPGLGMLGSYLDRIHEVVVAFSDQANLDFLRWLPHVTDVWVMTSSVKDLAGLRFCRQIRRLALERLVAPLHPLGELNSLEELFIDSWPRGADSIFRLINLHKVGIQKYGHTDLENIAAWQNLEELWLHRGRVRSLKGIPPSIKTLRLTNLKDLDSLRPLFNCPNLERLTLDGCREVQTLDGLEGCSHLKILSVIKGGTILSLEPLRPLRELNQVLLGDGTKVSPDGVEALYHLPALQKLIISKRSGLDRARLLANCGGCEVFLCS
jgi:hypothetical protein